MNKLNELGPLFLPRELFPSVETTFLSSFTGVPEGTYSFNAMGVPHLHDTIFSAAQVVPNPDPDQVAAGNTFLYDTWVLRRPDLEAGGDTPLMDTLGSGSDFRPFFFNLGVPSLDMVFIPDEVSSKPE